MQGNPDNWKHMVWLTVCLFIGDFLQDFIILTQTFFFLSQAHGIGLEDKKGPLENKVLDVPEATPVPYPIYQVL